jgi:hypothetical protein
MVMDAFIKAYNSSSFANNVLIPYHIDIYFCLPPIFADYACVVYNDVDSAECLFGFFESLCNKRKIYSSAVP